MKEIGEIRLNATKTGYTITIMGNDCVCYFSDVTVTVLITYVLIFLSPLSPSLLFLSSFSTSFLFLPFPPLPFPLSPHTLSLSHTFPSLSPFLLLSPPLSHPTPFFLPSLSPTVSYLSLHPSPC